MKKLLSVILSVFVMSVAANATPITIFNTGAATPGPAPTLLADGSPDALYTVSGPITGVSFVGANSDVEPYIHNSDSLASKWINPTMDATDLDPAGIYTYTTTFTLPGGFTGAMLSGRWLSDNEASMFLNGILVSMTPNSAAAFQMWTPFTIASDFMAGINTLTFEVTNDQVSPSALRVEFTSASFTSVPDSGSTVGLLLVALGGLFGVSRLRQFPLA